ncbi:MAG: threonine/serine exporter family protein [Clostridia bacterium]|nr:threonine/serine exporter family protein [Clostridia bacterium]
MDMIIKIIAGVISTVGFAIIFRLNIKHIPFAAIDGLFACVVYFCCLEFVSDDLFIANMSAAFTAAGLAEIFARIGKAPATVFLLPGCIALVPGGSLYKAMRSLLIQDYNEFAAQLLVTAKVGIAIGGGIIAVSIIRYFLNSIKNKNSKSN